MSRRSTPPRERPCVLVVDDNDDNRDIYATSLRHAGYDVEIAADGAEALRIAARSRPRVVLMDLGMPGMDGWEAIRRLRENPDTRGTYVIVVSGYVDAAHRKQAESAGCDEFLGKPCLPNALVARVEAILARK